MYVNPTYSKQFELFDTIVHESVHVFQDAMKYAQEDALGVESQAYHIAAIATNMLKDFYAMDEGRKAGLQT